MFKRSYLKKLNTNWKLTLGTTFPLILEPKTSKNIAVRLPPDHGQDLVGCPASWAQWGGAPGIQTVGCLACFLRHKFIFPDLCSCWCSFIASKIYRCYFVPLLRKFIQIIGVFVHDILWIIWSIFQFNCWLSYTVYTSKSQRLSKILSTKRPPLPSKIQWFPLEALPVGYRPTTSFIFTEKWCAFDSHCTLSAKNETCAVELRIQACVSLPSPHLFLGWKSFATEIINT